MIKYNGIEFNRKPGNYIRVGNNHIFIDWCAKNLIQVPSLCEMGLTHRIHIFITTPHSIGDSLIYLLKEIYNYDKAKRASLSRWYKHKKVIIHIPRALKDLYFLLTSLLTTADEADDKSGPSYTSKEYTHSDLIELNNYMCYMILVEDQGPSFAIPGSDSVLDIDYHSDGISTNIHLITEKYSEYHFPIHRGHASSINDAIELSVIENRIMAKHPELFKDKIISGFREYCPNKFLKEFKSDEEIWDYIKTSSNWKIVTKYM